MDFSHVTDAELIEARKQLIASAKKVASRKAFSKEFTDCMAVWQTIITKDKHRAENQECTLCQKCAVECPDDELPPLE